MSQRIPLNVEHWEEKNGNASLLVHAAIETLDFSVTRNKCVWNELMACLQTRNIPSVSIL